MRADLQRLKRDSDSGKSAVVIESAPASRKRRLQWVGVGVIAAIVMAVFLWQSRHSAVLYVDSANPRAIAVLPFQNGSSDKDIDFLHLALPDEVATALSYAPSLSIRPSAMTNKYVGPDLDLQQAGRDLRVTDIVTGHYLREGAQLRITLEAVNVEHNRLIWRDTLIAASPDMIGMHDQITVKVRQGLLPVLGVSAPTESGNRPKSQEAYDLYLHSLAMSRDPEPNKDAIAVLEHVVELDPTYAPAWEGLGMRYYWDAAYSNGAERAFQRSNKAYEKALALDPNRILAAGALIANRVERAELGRAYELAVDLVKRRPESAQAHFVLSYVFRYAGMLVKSTQECNTALTLDPGNYQFRSCAWTFAQLGQTDRALDYVRLDRGSEWASYAAPSILLRQGKLDEAREAVKRMPSEARYHRDLLEACLKLRPASELDRIAREAEASVGTPTDPELFYYQGSILAFCGQKERAVRLLRGAISGGYCSYSALLSDPLLAKLRETSVFDQLLMEAHGCQQKFLPQQN